MPRFFGSGPSNAGLAQWIGWFLRAGVTGIGREVDYIAHRARTSSEREKSAWVFRCVASCLLIAGEWALLTLAGIRADNPIALLIAWATIFLLPKPTPRIPLLVARILAVIFTMASLAAFYDLAKGKYPTAFAPYSAVAAFLGFAIWIVLSIWALMGLRSEARAHATASSGQTSPMTANSPKWSNIPKKSFRDVGGAVGVKREIRVIAENRLRPNSTVVVRNGILLHGSQGTGKNLMAEATAGEFRVNFHHVRCPELMGINVGSTSAEIRRLFEWASAQRPIVLFLDEIDSIGSRKQPQGSGTDAGGGGREYNTVTTQLMQSIDQYRSIEGLLLMAATNYLDGLEPTLIRDGRFDAKLRLDLPDEEGRKEILTAQLSSLGWVKHDLAAIARRTPGWSPARLRGLVDRAALLANGKPIEENHLSEALESTGGQDRPAFERVEWDDVILPQRVVADLQALIRLMDPGASERLSLPVPTGLILLGAPGMGKTMTARLIASQSKRSFYSITPSEVLSGAVGGSVRRLSDIFTRAKENAPSILFFDEMDGLFPAIHGPVGHHDIQLVEQALIEISALRPEHNVFLIGTTNFLDRVDPRILRGGRFTEKIELGIPDDPGYRKLVERYLGKAQLANHLTPAMIVDRVRGLPPADLEATINTMKRVAMRRMESASTQLPALEASDLEEAISRVQVRARS